jgi:hypothetical protein
MEGLFLLITPTIIMQKIACLLIVQLEDLEEEEEPYTWCSHNFSMQVTASFKVTKQAIRVELSAHINHYIQLQQIFIL